MQVTDKDGNIFGSGGLEITTSDGKPKIPVINTDITIGTTAIVGGVSGRLLFDDAGVVGETNGVHWDKVNSRLGLGTIAPAYKVDVQGTTLATSSVSVQGAFNIQPLTAPPAIGGFTLSAGTNLGVGQYYYKVVYVTAIGETNTSANLSVVTTTGNTTVNLTGIPVSSDPRVTARKLYRTKLGGSTDNQWFLATISNNTTTTYTDSIADASLTGVNLQAYKVNTTARYFTVSGTQGMIIDTNLTTLGRNAGNGIIASSGAAVRTVLIGAAAGQNITTGAANVIVGVAGAFLTTGGSNTLIGDLAGYALVGGSNNVLMGSQVGRYLNSASRNTILGSGAGSFLNDGVTRLTAPTNSIYIGVNARGNSVTETNAIVIGSTALGLGSNTTVIGNSSTTFTSIPAGNFAIGSTTDAGYKLDVNGTARVSGTINVTQVNGDVFRLTNGTYFHSTSGGVQTIDYYNGFVFQNAGQVNIKASFAGNIRFLRDSIFGTDGANNISAQLQIDSTTKGFLPPRQTQAQRTAIASPAVGLIVYQTDLTEGLYIYKSTGWTFIV